MNEILKFEFGGFGGNPFLVIGIGSECDQAVEYLRATGISETDFGVTSQISTIDFDKYKSVVSVMEYSDLNCLEYAKSIAARTKKVDAIMVGILFCPLLKEQTLKTYYSDPEIETLKNVFNFLLPIPQLESPNMGYKLALPGESEKSYQWLWFAYRAVFDMLNQQVFLWDSSSVDLVIKNGGIGFFATGETAEKPRLLNAVKNAVYFTPETIQYIREARLIVMQIISGADTDYSELDDMFNYLYQKNDFDIEIQWRITINEEIGEHVRISIVGTGLDKPPKERRNFDFLKLN